MTSDPDVDPCAQFAGEIAHDDWRIVRVAEPAGELDAFPVLEAVGQQPGNEEFVRLRRMPRQPERKLPVDLTVAVGEIDIEDEDGCGERHQEDDVRNTVTGLAVRLLRGSGVVRQAAFRRIICPEGPRSVASPG